MYTHEDIMIPIIIDCRVSTPKAIEFRYKIKNSQY